MFYSSIRRGMFRLAALAIVALPMLGCTNGLFTLVYLLKGTDVDPEFKDLKDKKVAVVCRPADTLMYSSSNVGRELAVQVSNLLSEKVPKIKIIDPRKVARWTDEHQWDEYVEVGRALKADMVVAIDLESFSLYQGQTLYQGKANATVRVYDCNKSGNKEVYKKNLPQRVYPPNACVPTSERTEPEFRHEFIAQLADQIGRHFYAHDPHADMALDARSLR